MPSLREALPWVLVLLLAKRCFWQGHKKRIQSFFKKQKTKRSRQLKPKSPEDCPACVAGEDIRRVNPRAKEPPPPWHTVKGRGGPRKRINTEGYCCDNPACRYRHNRDASVHALVGNGVRGITDDIQRFVCQACGKRFNARRNTALAHLKTSPKQIELAMNLSGEGVPDAVIARVFGYREDTVARWVQRTGQKAALLHDLYVRDLDLAYVQVDELQTKIRSHPGEKAWLWAAIDPQTKIVPTLTLSIGGRKTLHAMAFIHDLVLRLLPGTIPLFTSDGLRQYFWAITAHFGYWMRPKRARKDHWCVDEDLQYAQLIKKRKGRKLQTIKTKVMCGSRRKTVNTLQTLGYSSTINTSFIERFNLTFRHLVPALARRTNALGQTEQTLMPRLEWSRAYYHFVRSHSSLKLGKHSGHSQRERTPAMAAGLTDHCWQTLDILRLPLVAQGGT